MGIFSGVKEAKTFEDGRKLPEGTHKVKITSVIQRKSGRDGGDLYIVEYTVEESATAKPGEKYGWVQSMSNRNVALGALKQFAMAVMGADQEKDPAFFRQCEDALETALEGSVTSGLFNNKLVEVTTKNITTQKGQAFLKHTFRPA